MVTFTKSKCTYTLQNKKNNKFGRCVDTCMCMKYVDLYIHTYIHIDIYTFISKYFLFKT